MTRGRRIVDPDGRLLEFEGCGPWSSLKEAASYFAGIFDGEGHVAFYSYGSKGIQINNSDLSIIEASCQALNLLEIPYKVRRDIRYSKKLDKRYKDTYSVFIYGRENFIRVQELIPICSKEKKTKLEALIKSYKRPSKPSRPLHVKCSEGGDARVHAHTA